MCRDNNHGGRRCPNDTSESRRLRRANAEAKAEFKEFATPLLVTELTDNNDQVEPSDSLTIETVKKTIQELEDLKKYGVDLTMRNPAGQFIIPFDNITERYEASEANIRAMEAKVIEIGSQIQAIAIKKTGYTDEIMQTSLAETNRTALEAHGKIADELAAFDEELKLKYPNAERPTSSGSFLMRHAIVHEENEEAKKDEIKWDALSKQSYELRIAAQRAVSGNSAEVEAMTIANANAFREVLAEVRPLGGNITISDNSAKKESKLMQEVAEIYPTAWIEASNDGNSLRIKKTTRRAHYNDNASQKTYQVSDIMRGTVYPKDFVPDETDRWESGWIKVPDGEDYTDPKSGKIYSASYAGPDETFWIRPEYEYFSAWNHRSRDGVPVGPGWQKVTVKDYKGGLEEVYRRTKKERNRVGYDRQAEITIDGTKSAFGSDGFPTALHEFAHRIEARGPQFLDTMQTEFLRRRTTSVDGEHETKKAIYPKKKEYGRFDNFADKYMGKEYPGTRHHEVLSTGAEAVFAGRFGSLSGLGGYKADPDMKNFILGLWAAA